MFTTIRIRLTFSHLLVILIAMGLSGFLLLSFVEDYFLQVTEENLAAQAYITAQSLAPNPTNSEPPVTNQVLSNITQTSENYYIQTENAAPQTSMDLSYLADASVQLGTELNTRIRILDAQGMVLVDSAQRDNDLNLYEDSLVRSGIEASDYTAQVSENLMNLVLPIRVNDQTVGAVYLSQPLNDLTVIIRDLRQRWVLSTVIAVVLAGLVGLGLSQAITTPLRQLTKAAESVAGGHFDQQLHVQSRDELGRLSQTFNEMTHRLQAARQMQVNFVGNVSHELRTPLTSMKGLIETLREGAVEDLEVRDKFLETVETETNRLIRLVNDLLILSRADSEALNLRYQEVDLPELVQATIHQFTPENRHINLSVEAVPLYVHADPDRITQVMVNLLDNAMKYSKGLVTVRLSKSSHALIQVCDEGMGIPAADLPRIGQRFYRADKARSRSHGGSGLGVAIAKALIEAHGGKLMLESCEGAGTTASFTLPLSLYSVNS